ncbi:MAG: hypothetical protein GWP91_13740 [Rhodobacterales bacterium]|nr:hypothetical protein [Rhodobacterales bacterium]
MIVIWLISALAADNPVLDSLGEEMERNAAELSLPQAPPLYLLRYQLAQLESISMVASMGGVVREEDLMTNAMGVEVRVGSPEYDNTGFGGWQNGFMRTSLPLVLTPEAVQATAWRLTDRAYKQAVEQYGRKDAQFTAPEDYPGDYQMLPAVQVEIAAAPSDGSGLSKLALSLSQTLSDGPHLERSEVHVGHETGTLWTIDTTGTRIGRPVSETTMRALAQLRTQDGQLITHHVLWSVPTPAELPDAVTMHDQVRQMHADLNALNEAANFDTEYVGPVLFTQDAAVDLFRWLLVSQVEGTPAEVPFESWFGDLGGYKDPVRIGRRVLPPGWQVVDDPQSQPDHVSTYPWDSEGTPAQSVTLVADGIVKDLLMSRVPRKGMDGTNGHARSWLGARAEGRVTQLQVEPAKHLSEKALHKQALKTANAYDRDWYLKIDRLQEPAVRQVGQGFSIFSESEETPLPQPLAVIRVWADGREEVLRGAAFANVERFVLRDIIGAGEQRETTWMAPMQWGAGTTNGFPTWTSAPDVLIGEMEVVPVPGDPDDAPLVPPPSK